MSKVKLPSPVTTLKCQGMPLVLALPGLGGEYVFTLPTFTVVSDQVTFVTALFVCL